MSNPNLTWRLAPEHGFDGIELVSSSRLTQSRCGALGSRRKGRWLAHVPVRSLGWDFGSRHRCRRYHRGPCPEPLQSGSACDGDSPRIANKAAFIGQNDLPMIEKLRHISGRDYIDVTTSRTSIAGITRLEADFHLQPSVLIEGRLVFNPDDRWRLLKILDDAYLGSQLTAQK